MSAIGRARKWSATLVAALSLSVVVALSLSVVVSGAQDVIPARSAADSAFNAGDLARADSLYYLAARARPRDPLAREELGRYLGMRGATRVAVVLLEEARLFGADPMRIATQLAPLYATIGDWRALLTLQSSPLTQAERSRAAWLLEHAVSSRTDTIATAMTGPVRGDTLGRVVVRVGGRTAMATILGLDAGVMLGSRFLGSGTHVFASDTSVATVDLITVGTAAISNASANIGGAPGAVSIGMSALGALTPTFDYAKNRLSFNRPLSSVATTRLPLIRDRGAVRVLDRGRWVPLGEFVTGVARARQSITIDFRVGEARVQP